MIHVLRVEPIGHPETAAITGILADRIRKFAQVHDPYHEAGTLAASIMARLWKGDLAVFVLALAHDVDGIVGHVLAVEAELGFLLVLQTQADRNVDDALIRAEADLKTWAEGRGLQGAWMVTHRNPETWARRGWTTTHTIMQKRYDGEPVKLPRRVRPVANGTAPVPVEAS